MHDLVIRGGLVVDGSGAEAKQADVAIDGRLITAVGGEIGPGKREIDATGKLVTPGFVDMHTHYDAQVSWDSFLTPSSWHGCTTVIMGNCGVGFAPARPDRHDWLIQLMEGVEDIPGSAMVEGITWDWESFPEYLNAIEKRPHVMDFGVMLPHGALRAYVMGDRGADNEDANEDDIQQMYELTKEALKAGAMGFSTSRTPLHKSAEGELVPGTLAGRDELFGIGRALKEAKSGVFQLAPDQWHFDEEMAWMRDLAKYMEGPAVSFNLNQNDQQPDAWKHVLKLLEDASDLPIYAQVAGRAIGIVMALDGTAHPLMPYPAFMEHADKPLADRQAMLRDADFKATVLASEPLDLGEFPNFITKTFERIFPTDGNIDYEPPAEASVAAIAQRTGKNPIEVIWDHMAEGGMFYFPLFNFANGNLDPTFAMQSHHRTRMGLGDAGAHCGAICDGGMPTFMLSYWARDRKIGGKISLEKIIHRQTRQTAEMYGLTDRGLLAPGLRADVNVIDFERLGLEPAYMAYDLPAQGRRLLQRARGYVATICDGVIISENDEATGAMPGKLLRGTGPQASS